MLAKGHTQDLRPIEVGDTFSEDIPAIYLVSEVELPGWKTVKATLMTVDVAGLESGQMLTETARDVEAGRQRWIAQFSVPSGGFPLGAYRVELYISDKRHAALDFRVVAAAPSARLVDQTDFSGGLNIALADLGGKVRHATSQYDNSWAATYLNDGLPFEFYWSFGDRSCDRCGWSSKDATLPQEIVFSFYEDREAEVGAVMLQPATFETVFQHDDRMAKHVEIWVSTASPTEGYTRVTSVRLHRQAVEQLATFPPVRAKFLKLRIVSHYGGDYVQLGEVKIIESRRAGYRSILADSELNLLRPSLGGAIVRFTSQQGDHPASMMVDGSTESEGWRSSDGHLPQDFVFAFRADRRARIEKIVLSPKSQADAGTWVKAFTVSVSDQPLDGFREVGQFVLRQEPVDQTFPLGSIETRFVKVRILSNYGGDVTSLAEVKAIESRDRDYVSILNETPEARRETRAGTTGPAVISGMAQEVEPNNEAQTATPLTLGRPIAGQISPVGESDYFALDLRAASGPLLNLELQGKPFVSTSLTLLTSGEDEVKRFDPGRVAGDQVRLSWLVRPAPYYLKLHVPKISLVLIWDTSGSMTAQSLRDLEQAVTTYIGQIGATERILPIRFARDIEPLLQDFSDDKEQLLEKIKGKFSPRAATSLYDAIARGLTLLERRSGNRAVIVMTDGADTSSSLSHPALWQLLEKDRTRVYTIGLGVELVQPQPEIGSTGARFLGHVAEATGGRFFFARSSAELNGFYEQIAAELRAPPAYVLTASVSQGMGKLAVVETGERIKGVSTPARLELILDASGSMLEKEQGRRKIDQAQEVLARIIRDLPNDLEVGLRVFGHRVREGRSGACQDTELLVPFGKINKPALLAKIQGIKALGTTPIAHSLKEVENDFRGVPGEKLVILVTDGKEECGGKPSEVGAVLVRKGLRLRVEVVGFAIADQTTRQELARIAKLTGGSFHSAQDSASLEQAIKRAMAAPYEVRDSAGTKVAEGVIGGEAVAIPEGIYTVVVRSSPVVAVPNVRIAFQGLTRVSLKKEGQEIAIKVIGP